VRESRYLREIRRLDPVRDAERIVNLDACFEFPFDVTRSLELAFFRTFAMPSIAELLGSTGEFVERVRKRYDDTDLLISTFAEHGHSFQKINSERQLQKTMGWASVGDGNGHCIAGRAWPPFLRTFARWISMTQANGFWLGHGGGRRATNLEPTDSELALAIETRTSEALRVVGRRFPRVIARCSSSVYARQKAACVHGSKEREPRLP
jgi:hypothetical protein